MSVGERTGGSLSQDKQFFPAQGLALKPLFAFLTLKLLLTAESTKISACLTFFFFGTELHSPGVSILEDKGDGGGVKSSKTAFHFLS